MKQGLEKKRLKEDLSKKILSNFKKNKFNFTDLDLLIDTNLLTERSGEQFKKFTLTYKDCLLYTSPSPRDRTRSRMPSSA